MSFFKWSVTAATNATADSSINWAEGQAPSSVNNSARAMMAAAAKYRKDIGGVVTGGSSTAYTLVSNQVFDSLANMSENVITIIAHTTSGASPTLNVDGLGAKPLWVSNGVALPTGAMLAASVFSFVYINSSNAFFLLNATAVLNSISGNTVSGNMVATQANQETGTATDLIVTPGRQHFNPRHVKAWCNFNGSGTPAVAVGTGVSSITDNATGDYNVNWATAFSTANYGSYANASTTSGGAACLALLDRNSASLAAPAAGAIAIQTAAFSGGALTDIARVYVAALGDYA